MKLNGKKKRLNYVVAMICFCILVATAIFLSQRTVNAAPNYAGEWEKCVEKFSWKDTSDLGITPWQGGTQPLENSQLTEKVINYNGQEVDAYAIYTAEQFRWGILNQVNMKLMNDLDLGGTNQINNWHSTSLSITNAITIDGNGHTIYNMYAYASDNAARQYAGLISQMNNANALVKNLVLSHSQSRVRVAVGAGMIGRLMCGNLKNCGVESTLVWQDNAINGAWAVVAGLAAAVNEGQASITIDQSYTKDVHVYGGACSSNFAEAIGSHNTIVTNSYAIDGTLIVPKGHSGGFTSCDNGGIMRFENCFTNVDVYGNTQTGVFTGVTHAGKHIYTNCYTSGKIEGVNTIGGFIAQNDGGTTPTFTNCYSTSMVGMQDGGNNMGGFAGIGTNLVFENCYAAGEVGTETTATTGSATVYGFSGNQAGSFTNCYYDKQTTAMREKGVVGNNVQGLLTKQLMQTLPDKEGESSSVWVLTDGAYPQLKVFTEADQIFDTERDVLTALAYSEASASTAVLYPSYLEQDEYDMVITADSTNYDTVRDIRFVFPFTNNSMVKNDGFDIHWWADPSYKSAVAEMSELPVISLKEYPDFGVESLTPGVGWASVSVYLNDVDNEYSDIVGKRNLRLVPRTALTVSGSAGTDETIYAMPTDPEETPTTDGWDSTNTKYDHRDNVFFTYVLTGQSVSNAKVASYPINEQVNDVELIENDTTIFLANNSLVAGDNSKVPGKVHVTVTKDNGTEPIELTQDLLKLLYGERKAEPEDIGVYTLTYRWYAGGSDTSYLESQKKLTVKEAYWLDYRYNYTDNSKNINPDTTYHEDPGAYRDGDKISDYVASRTEKPYTYPSEPGRIGYEFLGWSTNKDDFGAGGAYWFDKDTSINSSLKLYAQWRAVDYRLSYDGNGHTDGNIPTDSNTYNITDSVSVQNQGSMVKKNHSFMGWNTKEDGSGDWYYPDKDDELVFGAGNITLYAQWKQNKTTITDVGITKSVKNEISPGGPTRVGDILEYTITAVNNSDSVWKDVVLRDTLSDGLELVGGSIKFVYGGIVDTDANNAHYNESTRTIESPTKDLELNDTYILVFKAKVTAAAMDANEDNLGNKAEAAGKDWEDGKVEKETPKVYPPGEDGDGREKPYWKDPNSYIQKSVTNKDAPTGPTALGDELEYSIIVENDEIDSMWNDVVISDLLPKGITFVPGSITGQWDNEVSPWSILDTDGFKSDYKDGKDAILYTVGDIKGGTIFTLKFKAVVNEAALSENTDNENIMNQAKADGKKPYGEDEEDKYEGGISDKVYPPDGNGGSGGQIRYKEPSGTYNKRIAKKSGEVDSTAVEDVLTYIITAENKKEDSLWDDVTITDVIPLGMELVPGTIFIQGPEDKAPVLLKDEDVYDDSSRTLKYKVGKIYGNERYELSFDVIITAAAMAADADDQAYSLIRNTAAITGKTPGGENHGGETDPVYPPGTGKKEEGGDGGRIRWKNPKGSVEKAVVNPNQEDYSVIGDTLEYTLTAENKIVNSCWSSVVLTDRLPLGLEYVPGSAVLVKPNGEEVPISDQDIFDEDTNTLSYSIGDIYGGEVYKIVFEAVLTSAVVELDAKGNDQAGNTAFGKGKRPDGGNEEDNSGKVYPPGYQEDETGGGIRYKEPDGELHKNVYGQNEGLSTVGDTLEYVLTADNYEAGSLWKNVMVTDKLPLGLTFVEGSVKVKEPNDSDFKPSDTYSYDKKSRIFSYQIGDIYGGESYAVSFEVTLNENAVSEETDNETVWNTAEISGGTPGGKTEEGGSNGVYPPDGGGKDGDGGKGGRIRYKNPRGYYAKAITSKSGEPDSTAVEDVLTYTITAENKRADSLWKDVEITDQLPPGMELIPGTIRIQGPDDDEPRLVDDSVYNGTTRIISYFIERIYGNQKYELSFDVVITAAALEAENNQEVSKLIKNSASISGTKPDGGKEGGDTNTVYPPGTGTEEDNGGKIRYKNPSGKVDKQVKNVSNHTGITVVDDILEYILVIENEEENSLWENVQVEDQLPAGVTFIPGSAKIKGPGKTDAYTKIADEDIYIDSDAKISYTIDEIYGGDSYTILFRVQVNRNAISDTDDTIGNEFAATGDQPDGKKHKKRSPKVYPPGVGQPGGSGGSEGEGSVQWKDPRPKFTKTTRNEAGRVNTTVGDILTYTLTVSNHEIDSVWENVVVRDDLPAGVTYVPGSLKVKGPGESGFTVVSDQKGYHEAERRIEFTLGDVYGNETYIIEFSAEVNESAVSEDKDNAGIRNTAAANGSKPGEGGPTDEEVGGPSYPADEDGSPSGRVRYKEPHSEVAKSVVNQNTPEGPTQVGDILTYTITAGNQKKNSLWDDVTIYDVLPPGMTFIEDSIMLLSPGETEYQLLPNTVYNARTRTIEYYIGPVYGGETYELIFDVQINASAVTDGDNTAELVGNQAWATGKKSDGEEENTDKTDPILPPGIDGETRVDFRKPVGGINKAARNKNRENATTVVGDIIEYSISVTNAEEYSIWRDALLKDDMPLGVEIKAETMVLETPSGQKVIIEPDAYNEETRTIAIYIGDINYGETYTLTFQAEVTPDAIGRNIGNLAAAWTSLNRSTSFSFYPGYPYEEGIFGRIPEDQEDRDDQGVDPEEDDYVYVEVPDMVYPSIADDPEQSEENDPDESTNTVLPYDPEPEVSKEAENLTHPDGDTRLKDRIRYTITLSNRKENSVWKNLSIMDYLPEGMMLDLGSMVLVYPNGNERALPASVYNNASRLLSVPVSEIKGGESYTLIYEVEVYVGDVEEPEKEPPIVNKVEVTGENPDGTPTDEIPEDTAEIDYPIDAKKRPRGSIEIIKVDADDDQIRLGGAKFLLYWYNPEAEEYQLCSKLQTTGEKEEDLGKILFTDLPEGEYRLDEMIAPDNYKKPEGKERETYFELHINDDESALILYAKDRAYTSSSILIPNEKLEPGDLQITKVDKDYYEILLEGAEFKLEKFIDQQEEEVEEEPQEEINEEDPEGEPEDQTEPVNDIAPDSGEEPADDIESEEEQIQQTAEITANQVPGVNTGDNSDIEKYWTGKTDAEGLLHFEIKEPGRYRLTEIAAPDGYLLGEKSYELEFEVVEEEGVLVISTGIWSCLIENQAKEVQQPWPPVEPVDPPRIPEPQPDPETEKETEKLTKAINNNSGRGTSKVPPTSDAGRDKQMWLLLMLSGIVIAISARKKRISG